MSNVQIIKQCKNVTTDKLNVNSRSSAKKLPWVSDGLKSSTHSLPLKTSSWLKITLRRSESECSPGTLPPMETQADDYEVIIPAFTADWCIRLEWTLKGIPNISFHLSVSLFGCSVIYTWNLQSLYSNFLKNSFHIHFLWCVVVVCSRCLFTVYMYSMLVSTIKPCYSLITSFLWLFS